MNKPQLEVLYHKSEHGVVWITLNVPATQNRVNMRMATELRKLCEHIGQDDSVKVVVLTGSGETFCSGDENNPQTLDSSEAMGDLLAYIEMHRTAGFISGIEKPVVAAINGDAIGHGLEMILACDIRIAGSNAKMGMPQITEGYIPWDGGTQRLPRAIGRAWATDLLLSGRIIDSSEALRIGLIHQVTSPSDVITRAQDVSATIAALAPVAARYAKEAVLKGADMTLDQGLRLEVDLNLLLQTTEDRSEGIASFLERRQPTYNGR